MKELTCQQLVELVTTYLDGALSTADHARFDAHLAICDGCTAYLAQMRRTIELTGRLSSEAIEEPMRERLLVAFRGWNDAGRPADRMGPRARAREAWRRLRRA